MNGYQGERIKRGIPYSLGEAKSYIHNTRTIATPGAIDIYAMDLMKWLAEQLEESRTALCQIRTIITQTHASKSHRFNQIWTATNKILDPKGDG